MAKPEITREGIQIQTYQEIYDELAQGFRDIYGADIDLDPESPDGQRLGIYAAKLHDLQVLAVSIANNFDPDLAQGLWQEMLLKFSGIEKRPPIRSQVDVEVTADYALTLPEGYTVQDDLGQKWELQQDTDIGAGTSTVTLFAEEFGPIEAEASTVTEPITIVLGVSGVTNPSAAVPGQNEETEPEVRRRRGQSVQAPAYSTTGSLFARLADIPDVTDLKIYENTTSSTDSKGVPAHSLWCIIEGGEIAKIIETIVKNKTGGTGLKGIIEETYVEENEWPNGDSYDLYFVARFDRPVYSNLEVQLNVYRKDADDPVDTAAIADALAEETFRIAENVIPTQLYPAVYSAGDNFYATDLEVRRKGEGESYVGDFLEANPDEVFQIDSSDVTVNEVT